MSEKKVVSEKVSVELTPRSEYGSSGGCGYWDQVTVHCGNQKQMQEWNWRDRYSAKNDRPWLGVCGLGQIDVSENEDDVVITVELLNKEHGNRTATFTFDRAKEAAIKKLSANEQDAFTARAESEMLRVMAELNRLWECKVKMVNPFPTSVTNSYVTYRRPSVKKKVIHPEIGVAAFVTEEQIDHIVSDPQMRYELHVLKFPNGKAESITEDHGYNRADGGAFLSIIEVEQGHIIINTKAGKSTIKL